MERRRLADAITDYVNLLKLQGAGDKTLASKQRTLGMLFRMAGNCWVYELQLTHFEQTMTALATPASEEENALRKAQAMAPRTGRGWRSLKHDEVCLRGFADWAADHQYLALRTARLVLKTYVKPATQPEVKEIRRILPVTEWPAVIEAAEAIHPRTRMMTILGLTWGRRASEVPGIRFRDLDTELGEALITNVKSRKEMVVPIDQYMAEALQTWSTWLGNHMVATGRAQTPEVNPDWYLIPGRLHGRDFHNGGTYTRGTMDFWPVDPTRPITEDAVIADAKRVLAKHGWAELKGEGMHTFRRSAAVAWDEIGEIGVAQALLGHSTRSTTEGYTQNRAGVRRLKTAFAGNPYGLVTPPAGDNVISLDSRRSKAS